MNIIIPEDENYPNVVIDFRDIVYAGKYAKDLNRCVMAMEKRTFVFSGEDITTENIKKYFKLNSENLIKKHISKMIEFFLASKNIDPCFDYSDEMKVIFIPKDKRKIFLGIPSGENSVQSIKIQLKNNDDYHYISIDSAGELRLDKIHLISSYEDGCGMKEFREQQNVATQN